MGKRSVAVVFVATMLLLPVLGILVGYQLADRGFTPESWKASNIVRGRVAQWRQVETVAGAFAMAKRSIEGLEGCYYTRDLDFSRITWVGKDIPTPYVGYAPMPGPLASGHINSMQFRYGRELAIPKPAGLCRIFVTGGSTAYSAGATSNATTIGGYLEKYLNDRSAEFGRRFEVITAAAPAWTSTHERILVENRLVELEPDIVIAVSGHNDAFWSSQGQNVMSFRSFRDDYFFLLANSLLRSRFGEELPQTPPALESTIPAGQAALRLSRNVRLAHASLEFIGADYCFVLQPNFACSRKTPTERERQLANPAGDEDLRQRYAAFRSSLGQLSFPRLHFYDLTGVFDELDAKTEVFIDSCHFGERGNDLIARAIFRVLEPVLYARLKVASR